MWNFPIPLTVEGPDMNRKRYSQEQIIAILREHEAGALMQYLPDLSEEIQ